MTGEGGWRRRGRGAGEQPGRRATTVKGTLQITDECSFSYGHGDYGLFRGGVVTSAPTYLFFGYCNIFEQFFLKWGGYSIIFRREDLEALGDCLLLLPSETGTGNRYRYRYRHRYR